MSDSPNDSNDQASDAPATQAHGKFTPLRIWPAVVLMLAMAALWGLKFLPNLTFDDSMPLLLLVMMGPLALGAFVMIWWVTFSRATASERIVGLVGTILVAVLAVFLSDKTMLGPAIIMITIPMGTAAFAIGAILCRQYLSFNRTMVAVLLAACGFGFTALLSSNGYWGHGAIDWHWRWEASDEEKMLAERKSLPATSLTEVSASEVDGWLAEPEWPRFRGRDALGVQHGPQIAVDWASSAPEKVWRMPVGPGWSSFVVAGNLLFTQEQHGEDEAIVCYAADTGKAIWMQTVKSRFFDSMGGAGPRATPTLAQGGLFAQGANGQLQRLDPKSGEVVWSKDLREVADREPPTWGFSSSPLVVGSVVITHAGGTGDKGTLAFDVENGDLKWSAPAGDHSYSSPHLAMIGGDEYVLMLTNTGLDVLDPDSGERLLDYGWKYQNYRVLQPQVIAGDSVLLPTGLGAGTRLVRIAKSDTGLAAEERWTSQSLKPDFNDFVVHENHAYGFDNSIFTCIDLATGERKWRRGRYGKGQVLLLADSGHLLVASEKGEVVLLKADPAEHVELTKFRAIEGRTWNHPVVIGDRLYIRNSQEAACYRLPLASVEAVQ